ncbi:DUF6089 family protein [Bacteroidales bacterium OttesenSCG-928-A17]|nr:DUF6089 family protein [Bacteroidales bacterium OttesenSCG-928-A17]
MKSASINVLKIKKGIGIFLLLIVCATAVGQEYKYEIGGGVGASMYMGDANQTSLTKGWNPALDVIFRRNFNFRWAFKGNLMMGKVSGNTENTANVFPDFAQASFSRNFFELGGHMEFNFMPYSDKFAYLNTSRLSPYILSGFGFTLAPGDGETFFGVNLPLGIGVKYKVKNRINLGVEFTVHKLFGDAFDAPDKKGFHLDNPYNVKNGLLKNKDWYNTLMFSITWDFGPNDRKCSNE